MSALDCIARDGTAHTFYYVLSDALPLLEWYLDVYDSPIPCPPAGMQLTLVKYDSVTLMVSEAAVGRPDFEGRGIRDALIPLLPNLTGKRICSSSDSHPIRLNEYRTPAGTAVWKRLTGRGLARYDAALDRYFLL